MATIFQFTKTVDKKHVHVICHTKNYISLQSTANISAANLWWDRHFANQIFMPWCGILQHATACRNHAEAAPHRRLHYFRHLPRGKAAFCYILPCDKVWTLLQIEAKQELFFRLEKSRSDSWARISKDHTSRHKFWLHLSNIDLLLKFEDLENDERGAKLMVWKNFPKFVILILCCKTDSGWTSLKIRKFF